MSRRKLLLFAGSAVLLIALLLFWAALGRDRVPTAEDASAETDEDTPVSMSLSARDPDGDALTWTTDTPPSHGTLAGSPPGLTHEPVADRYGPDSTSDVSDGAHDSDAATVTMTVAAVKDAPLVEDISATTPEKTPVDVVFKASDVDGDDLTFEVVSAPGHGALSGQGDRRTYAPEEDWTGTDSFTYRTHDGETWSETATVSVRTTPRGTVWAWGENERGQLGDGTREERLSPHRAEWLARATQVSAGWYHSLALLEDGSVWAWGSRSHVPAGEDEARSSRTPMEMQQLPRAVAIATGDYHSLVLAEDGAVWEWQASAAGVACHAGPPRLRSGVQRVRGLAGVIAVEGGSSHSLALKKDGTVWAWGLNRSGQLGDGTRGKERRDMPSRVEGLAGVTAIAAGYSHSLALKPDGTVWAWGANGQGQLGDGTTEFRSTPVRVRGLTDAVAVAAGGCHSLAVRADRTISSWGWNEYGQLGDGTTEDRPAPVQVLGLTDVSSVAAGSLHSFAVMADGTALAWGRNTSGQLGDGTRGDPRLTPVEVKRLVGVSSIAGGACHSLAVEGRGSGNHTPEARDLSFPTAEGEAAEVSLQASDPDRDDLTYEIVEGPFQGELSGEGPARTYIPKPGYTGDDTFAYHVLDGEAVSNTAIVTITVFGGEKRGRLWAWGFNVSGQLGDGTTENRHAPVPVRGLRGVTAVSGGNHHSLALRNDGTVWAWGRNRYGRLGDGTREDRRVAVPVTTLTGVKAIGAGGWHSLALKKDGRVWSWGWNRAGKLGDGTTDDRDAPVRVKDLADVIAVGAGGHTLALKRDGTVWGWGFNHVGQVGDGTTEHRLAPVQVRGLKGVKAVSAGGPHSHALLTDGTVLSWGWNREGQLGDGTTKHSRIPVQVRGLTDVTTIAAGQTFCLALKEDGTVWSWGNNAYGQLGDGTTVHRHTPVRVHGLTDVKTISAGYWHALALKKDGTVWAWGQGHLGQIGDGVGEHRHEPVQVEGLKEVVAIAAAGYHSLVLSHEEEIPAHEEDF